MKFIGSICSILLMPLTAVAQSGALVVPVCGGATPGPGVQNLYQNASGQLCTAGGGSSGGNAAAGATGSAVPADAGYTGINDGSGNLVGVGPAHPMPTTSILGTTNGWTPLRLSALSTTVVAIKGSPGELAMAQCYNPNATQVYLQVFNVVYSSVSLGSTAPTLSIPIAPSATGGYALSNPGINFSTAMSAAITTTATGSTAPGTAADCNAAYN
jgi:hypothetical protein